MAGLKAILVDDEISSPQNLLQKILQFCLSVTILSTSQDPVEAIEPIKKHQPDVVFLDIEILGMSGLRMA